MRTNISLTPFNAASIFDHTFIDETRAKNWVKSLFYVQGEVKCPKCQAILDALQLIRFDNGKDVRCRSCGRIFKILSGTMLEGMHLTFAQFMLMVSLMGFGWNNAEISIRIDVDRETVRLWRKKIKLLGGSAE